MLSIITITFNNYDELVKTLNSIPVSDSIESVIVNGGSCEKTKEFLKNYHGKSITEKDNGIADAFNKGIKISSGDFIMFLNSGDVLLNKSYLNVSQKILHDKNDLDFIHSNLLFIDEKGNELLMKPQMKSLGRGMPFFHPTMIVRRNLFEKIGLFNDKFKIAMDFDWIVRLKKYGSMGNYINADPVVKMDGTGKSVVSESVALKECFEILKTNKYLTLKNIYGYFIRYTLYISRVLMVKLGFGKYLTSMKKIKHS